MGRGVVLLCCFVFMFSGEAMAFDREQLRHELEQVGRVLHTAITAKDVGPIVESFSAPSFVDIGHLWVEDAGCEEPGFTSSTAIVKSLRNKRGDAYSLLFDTARLRKIAAHVLMWRRGMEPPGIDGPEFFSIRDHFLQAGSEVWIWVEVTLPYDAEQSPEGIVHYEWPGRALTEFNNPGFTYIDGVWRMTNFFGVWDSAENPLFRMAKHAVTTVERSGERKGR